MRRIACVVLALLIGGPSFGDAHLCSSSTGRSIGVHGTAVLHQHPDRATFSVGVQTQNPSVAAAFNSNSSRANAVLSALKSRGVTPEELQTSYFEITTVPATKTRPRTFQV